MKPAPLTTYLVLLAALLGPTLECPGQSQGAVLMGGPGTSGMALQPDRNAAGTISGFNVGGFTLVDALGSATAYLMNSETQFLDMRGHAAARENITAKTPVAVYFTPVGNALLATRIVMGESLFSDGTIIEVKPGGLLMEPGALASPVRYVTNGATAYVNQKDEPVQSFHSGAVVRVFYSRVGDALMASKLELLPGTVQTAVKEELTKTRTEVKP